MITTTAPGLSSSNQSKRLKPIKQGWVLKKSGSGMLAPWRPKYLVIVQGLNGGSKKLQIFDNLQQTNPKHLLDLNHIRVEVKSGGSFGLLSKNAVAFTIYTQSRKFYLAASTRQEYNDWMAAFTNPVLSASPTRPPTSFEQQQHNNNEYRKNGLDNSDARSVYSVNTGNGQRDDDDTMSMVSCMSRATMREEFDGNASAIETLSFSSEPVLTPYELNLLGQDSLESLSQENPQNPYIKRRVLPHEEANNVQEIDWHNSFVEILDIRAITEEQTLQKDIQLMEHIGAFQERAAFHAQNIIDEYHINGKVSSSYKMNSSMTCIKENIVFRFACDYDTASPSEIELALKKTSAELLSINSVIKAVSSNPSDTKRFYTILMALVDYKGFRIVAHADLGPSTHIIPIHDLNPKRLQIDESTCNVAQPIGNALNLLSHTVQVNDDRRVRIPFAATVEIHLDSKTNRNYLTCLRDIFPMDHFTSQVSSLRAIQDSNSQPTPSYRLRPEFLQVYQSAICSDILTPASGATRREKELNDEEGMKASRFLRETWIPAFIRSLDAMDIRPFDSASLTILMHNKGINMRYLGFICQNCTIPFIRTMTLIEMIARVCKNLFQNRLRGAILHFRSVGATSIEDQMHLYTTNMLSVILGYTDKTIQFIESKIKPELIRKFDFTLSAKEYQEIPRSALFLAIQHHCGITFEDHIEYDFCSDVPISKTRLVSFDPRVKTLSGTQPNQYLPNSKDDNMLAYAVAKHFKSLGPKSKLVHSNASASILNFVASHYNNTNRFEEARLYAQAAAASAQKNHCLFALASCQLLYAVAGLQATALNGPEPSLLGWYGKAQTVMTWHWGPQNPLSMTLHDRMSAIYHKAKDPILAFDFHKKSLEIADQTLGNNHNITAGYLTRAGCYLGNLGKYDEAMQYFTRALNIFVSSRADPALIAEVHYHYADVLAQKGSYDKAVEHAQKCRKIRESCFGFSDIRVIHSCRQVAKFLREPYKDYQGVMTGIVKAAYRESIACHEKVFRYLQNQQGTSRRRSIRRSHSINSMYSMSSSLSQPGMRSAIQTHPGSENKLVMAGPLVVSPFGWTPPFPKNLLHRLTKDIVGMKLALIDAPAQKECIRMLRMKRSQGTLEHGNALAFDPEEARAIIMKMAAVTPSVYLDDVMQRVSEGDDTAVYELGVVLVLTESETVGLSN